MFIFYILYFIFVSAMFDILLQKRGENTATPPRYIFVFVNEVFDKISAVFQLMTPKNLHSTHYTAKHPPEIYPHLEPQNISLLR